MDVLQFIHFLVDGHCILWGAMSNKVAILFMHESFCGWTLLFLLGKSRSRWLGCMLGVCLTIRHCQKVFQCVLPLCIPISDA